MGCMLVTEYCLIMKVREGETFVTRKITRGLANISLARKMSMGNLDALRDWGHAKDYVRMQWMMLQREVPKDYVIATENNMVREFIKWTEMLWE